MSMQQYCLRWNNHQPNFISVFSHLLNSESLVDVTLSADGRHLQAHKLVLSACSSYFQSLFTMNPCQHPIVILKDVKFTDLKVIIDFMYFGEVNVSQDQLPHILKTAEALKIKGLAEIPVEAQVKPQNNVAERTELSAPPPSIDTSWNTEGQRQHLSPAPCPLSPTSKRKRLRRTSTSSGSAEKYSSQEHSQTESSSSSTVIKPDPGGSSEQGTAKTSPKDSSKQALEQVECISPNATQITMQIPQEVAMQHVVDNTIDIAGPSVTSQPVTERVIITTHAQVPQAAAAQQTSSKMIGSKRSRFLMRQPRIKKDADLGSTPESESHYLSVPHLRVERQVSDPLPAASSPPSGQHLTVPGASMLVKQHSHPLLPSQMSYQSASPPLPLTTSSQIQILTSRETSPIAEEATNLTSSLRVKSVDLTTSTLKVRSDELKRSVSSPSQTNTRSSHCPVVRPGPALGCNYCWNTVDNHGRILRRKTKYHCPECQTNLCIVPCFQEYHERHATETVVVPSTVRIFPKTTTM